MDNDNPDYVAQTTGPLTPELGEAWAQAHEHTARGLGCRVLRYTSMMGEGDQRQYLLEGWKAAPAGGLPPQRWLEEAA